MSCHHKDISVVFISRDTNQAILLNLTIKLARVSDLNWLDILAAIVAITMV